MDSNFILDNKFHYITWEFMIDLLLNCTPKTFVSSLHQVKLRKYQKLQLISRLKQRRRVLE